MDRSGDGRSLIRVMPSGNPGRSAAFRAVGRLAKAGAGAGEAARARGAAGLGSTAGAGEAG